MKKVEKSLPFMLGAFIGLVVGGLFSLDYIHSVNNTNRELQKELQEQRLASDKYVWACERLLDRICEDDESFYDVTAETDEYSDYVKAAGNIYIPTEQPK